MGKVFIVAIVLDLIYELIVYRWVYPGQAVIVATVLAIVPYLLILGRSPASSAVSGAHETTARSCRVARRRSLVCTRFLWPCKPSAS